jgi:hypothetical protein
MDKQGRTEADAMLHRERKARGKIREGHLNAGRQLAMDENRSRAEAATARAGQEALLNTTEAAEQATRRADAHKQT